MVALAALTLGFVADGVAAGLEDEPPSLAEVPYADIELFSTEIVLPEGKPIVYLVASSEGVYQCTDSTQELLWSGRAYDVLSLPDREQVVISARYDDEVILYHPDFQLTFPADGPVDCEVDGTTLVVVQNGSNEVVAYDMNTGDTLWRVGGFSNLYDVALLSDGGFVVADSGNGRVVEFDADRQQVAEYTDLGFPSSLEVLPNGNLQVTTYHAGGVIELERGSGHIVKGLSIDGTVFRAVRDADGGTLVFEGERSEGVSQLHWFDADGEKLGSMPIHAGTDFDLR